MSNFNLSDYLKNRKEFNFVEISLGDVDICIIKLTEEFIDSVKLQETYTGMLCVAADFGVSIGRDRVCDDAVLAECLEEAWPIDELAVDGDMTIREMVGLEVCELSGIADFVNEKKEYEALEADEAKAKADAEKVININDEMSAPGNTDIDNLDVDEMKRCAEANQ